MGESQGEGSLCANLMGSDLVWSGGGQGGHTGAERHCIRTRFISCLQDAFGFLESLGIRPSHR